MDDRETHTPKATTLCAPMRWVLVSLGVLSVGIGIAGLVIPGLPGVVFLLFALWAFSKSSERLHLWLYNHPRLGKPLRDWHAHRVIPVKAKTMAIAMMGVTAVVLVLSSEPGSILPYLMVAGMAPVAAWIWTRRSEAPIPVESSSGLSVKE